MTAPDDRGLRRLRAAADGPAGDLRIAVSVLSDAEARRLLVEFATADAAWRAGAIADAGGPLDSGRDDFIAALDQAQNMGRALDAIADEGDLEGLIAAVLAMAYGDLGLAVLEPRLRRVLGGGS